MGLYIYMYIYIYVYLSIYLYRKGVGWGRVILREEWKRTWKLQCHSACEVVDLQSN